MRGTGEDIAYFTSPVGITPAHAGNSLLPVLHSGLDRDHPRTCGEQLSVSLLRLGI